MSCIVITVSHGVSPLISQYIFEIDTVIIYIESENCNQESSGNFHKMTKIPSAGVGICPWKFVQFVSRSHAFNFYVTE